MTPALRDMTITTAHWSEIERAWIVALPGGVLMPARTEADVEDLIRKHATGSAVRYVRPSPTSPGTIEPAEAG